MSSREDRGNGSPLFSFVRWIILLPCAIGGALLAGVILLMLSRIEIAGSGENALLDSLQARVLLIGASRALMGAAFVFIGMQIAPSYRRAVGNILAALGLLFTGYNGYRSDMCAERMEYLGELLRTCRNLLDGIVLRQRCVPFPFFIEFG